MVDKTPIKTMGRAQRNVNWHEHPAFIKGPPLPNAPGFCIYVSHVESQPWPTSLGGLRRSDHSRSMSAKRPRKKALRSKATRAATEADQGLWGFHDSAITCVKGSGIAFAFAGQVHQCMLVWLKGIDGLLAWTSKNRSV